MKTTSLLAQLSMALVPRDADVQRCRRMAAYFLDNMPRHIRLAFTGLLYVLWGIAAVFRRGQPSRMAAMVAWIGALAASNVPLLHSLGLWFKATACLIVLSDEAERRQLYDVHGLQLPSMVPLSVVQTGPEHAAHDAQRAARGALGEQHGDQRAADATERAGARAHHGARAAAEGVLDAADFIVVGSGPAGATVARALAVEGCDVLLLEEGPPMPKAWAAKCTLENMVERFRASGTLVTTGPERIPVLQGRGVGGSSVINSAIVWRAPEDVFARWYADDPAFQAHLPLDRVDAAYNAVETAIGIQRTGKAIYGTNTDLMAAAAASLGIKAEPTRRYVASDCEGLGRCMEGCPKGHKLSMNVTFVPDAVRAGARLYSDCLVYRVDTEGHRAVGVAAKLYGKPVRFRARKGVVIAASAIQTPLLLKASGIRHSQVGARFQAHPGASIAGVFDRVVRDGKLGATQGYDSIHFRTTSRFKLETLSLPDELLATRFPGVGDAFSQSLGKLPNTALWAAQVRARAHGRVTGSLAMPRVIYHFTRADQLTLGRALKTLGDMFFAAGAREVLPGVVGLPARITEPQQLDSLLQGVHPKRVAMIASHLFGTAAMGSDPARSVCDPYGQVYAVRGLYVADSSLFPTNIGVNPQHSIMALAQHVAWGMLEQRKQLAA